MLPFTTRLTPFGRSAMPRRLLYAALGWCAVAFAVAGALLPGLPTTVFVIAAAWCFSRSSRRFEQWLRENPLLGPFLRRVRPGGGMPASAKRAALTAMWTAILCSSVVLVGVHWAAAIATIGLGVIGTLSILFAVRTVP
jgi:uncharacterized membrane protein YbaN (DUF454 family)